MAKFIQEYDVFTRCFAVHISPNFEHTNPYRQILYTVHQSWKSFRHTLPTRVAPDASAKSHILRLIHPGRYRAWHSSLLSAWHSDDGEGRRIKGNVLALRAWGWRDVEVRFVTGMWQGGSLSLHSFLEVQYYPVQTQPLLGRQFIALHGIHFYNKDGHRSIFRNVNNYLTTLGHHTLQHNKLHFLIVTWISVFLSVKT
jgi:hypothetical protein